MAARIPIQQFEVPFRDQVIDSATNLLTVPWQKFFRLVQNIIEPLGYERFFDLTNNQSTAVDILGMSFNKARNSHAIVEYLIQRITSGGGATEIISAGIFHAVYNPISEDWSLVTVGTPGPDSSGITFSITALGQVQYTSSNITGTALISKITFRSRTLSAKNSLYSTVGPSR